MDTNRRSVSWMLVVYTVGVAMACFAELMPSEKNTFNAHAHILLTPSVTDTVRR